MRLARAGLPTEPERPPDADAAWPQERRALLDELRRRIEGLERRPLDGTIGPRLPPAASTRGGVGGEALAELRGAEETPFGVRFRARIAVEHFDARPAEPPVDADLWLGRLAVTRADLAARARERGGAVATAGSTASACPPAAALDLGGARIVDCETTGLAGGTGTVAFLVGVAWLDRGDLVVTQLLLRSPREEPSFLDELLGLLGSGRCLVSFNGRSFDAPLLRTRCILARRRPGPLVELPHVDLLPPARRMWRHSVGDCRLVALEERVLGRARVDDVSGAFAPLAYTRFLRAGDPSGLESIVEHNREDLVGTAGLLLTTLRILGDPARHASDATELRTAGLMREEHDGTGAGLPQLARALDLAHSPRLRRRLYRELARVHRGAGHWPRAAELWRAFVHEFPGENLGFVELAKLLERRARDPGAALAVLARVPHPGSPDVAARRARLERRAARAPAGALPTGSRG
jgi:hypothetical protein